MAAFTAKAVVVCLILLIGLRDIFEGAQNFSKFSSSTSDKSIDHEIIKVHNESSSEHPSLRGKNQTHPLTVNTRVSQSSDDSHHGDPESNQGDISPEVSSAEEANDDNSERDRDSQSNSVDSNEHVESKSHHSTWERMWMSQIPTDQDGNDDDENDVSINEKERLWQRLPNQTFQVRDLFAAFPRPERQNSIALYNEDAYDELISDLLQSHQNGRNFTIVASGGSTTCGAAKNNPVTPQGERYYSQLAGYLNTLLSEGEDARQTVQWIGQGHGARTSLHTAIFFDNFIPRDSDLLLWEFSINDAFDWHGDPDIFRQSVRNDLLVWLKEVGRMERPAKVMLVYYWDTPYHLDVSTNEIVGRAFEAHTSIAREFDFVVGHINVGSFIDEVNFPGCSVWESCPLLADKQHASKLGHIATAYLLLNLMNPSKEFLLPPPSESEDIDKTSYEWTCGLETASKQKLKDAVTDPEIGWKSSLGGWTLDLPAYNQTTSRILIGGPGLGDIELVDKADPLRQDRKRCTALKYCDEETSFSVIAPHAPMEKVHAVLMVFKKLETVLRTSNVNVFLNGSNATTTGRLVPMRTEKDESILRNWPCHLSGGWSAFADTYWYVFETPQTSVNSMELCIPSDVRIPPKIQSVAFW